MLALLAVAALGACAAQHSYVTQEYSAPAGAASEPLRVMVRFPAGGVTVHAGETDRLYRAAVTYCREHTAPSAVLETPGVLTLSLASLPGAFVGFGGEDNEMRLDLSPVVPQRLELNLGEGESVIDVSGLKLTGLHVIAGAGDTRLIFGRPNSQPADEVVIEGIVGDIGVDLLGNANADRVAVSGGVGSLDVDLGGAWSRDGSVEISASVGDLHLRLPVGPLAPGIRLKVGAPWSEKLELAGYRRQGAELVSDNYGEAPSRLDVVVLAGIGKMTVVLEDDHREASR